MKIQLSDYGSIISDKQIGEKIYHTLSSALKKGVLVEIDFQGIKSMATFCAKQIFGALYLELTPPVFFEKIEMKNVSEDLKLIIKMGIQDAIETRDSGNLKKND